MSEGETELHADPTESLPTQNFWGSIDHQSYLLLGQNGGHYLLPYSVCKCRLPREAMTLDEVTLCTCGRPSKNWQLKEVCWLYSLHLGRKSFLERGSKQCIFLSTSGWKHQVSGVRFSLSLFFQPHLTQYSVKIVCWPGEPYIWAEERFKPKQDKLRTSIMSSILSSEIDFF